MNTSVSRQSRVVDMLDEAYAGPCSIARDPRPSRKVVSTLQVSRFMARQVPNWNPWQRGRREQPPSGQPPEFTDPEGPGQVEMPRNRNLRRIALPARCSAASRGLEPGQ